MKQKNFNHHGLTWEECKKIAEAQGWACPLTGWPLILDEQNKKILDGDPKKLKKKWAAVDHCHKTGKIRGFLSDVGNWAIGGYERGRYGKMAMSSTMIEYLEADYVKNSVGLRLWPKFTLDVTFLQQNE